MNLNHLDHLVMNFFSNSLLVVGEELITPMLFPTIEPMPILLLPPPLLLLAEPMSMLLLPLKLNEIVIQSTHILDTIVILA